MHTFVTDTEQDHFCISAPIVLLLIPDTPLFDIYDGYNLHYVKWSQKLPSTSSVDDCESQCLQLSDASAECVAAVFEGRSAGGGGHCSVLLGNSLLLPPPIEASVGRVAMIRNGFYYNSEYYVGVLSTG